MQYVQDNIIPTVEKTGNVKYFMWTLDLLEVGWGGGGGGWGKHHYVWRKMQSISAVEISYINLKIHIINTALKYDVALK